MEINNQIELDEAVLSVKQCEYLLNMFNKYPLKTWGEMEYLLEEDELRKKLDVEMLDLLHLERMGNDYLGIIGGYLHECHLWTHDIDCNNVVLCDHMFPVTGYIRVIRKALHTWKTKIIRLKKSM